MANFIRGPWFMAIIIALVSAAVIALVIFGVTTHHEAGFATASTPIEDGFVPPDYGETRPLGVCVQSYPLGSGASADDLSAVNEAVHITNQRVGAVLFEVGDVRTYTGGCAVVATIGVPQEVSADPRRHSDSGGGSGICADSCCFSTWNTGTTEMLLLALQHELAHCLGLAHDPDDGVSIMNPDLHPTPSGSYPPRISDSDRELLRGRYIH